MNAYPRIYLKPKKEIIIQRFHPWIFSGAIHSLENVIEDGSIVEVFSSKDKYLATGFYFNGSIAVKILSFQQKTIDLDFWTHKISKAILMRKEILLNDTTAYRLIHAEGDGIPGLIIDVYNDMAVIQAHSIGIYKHMNSISTAIKQLLGDQIKAIYSKSKQTLPPNFASAVTDEYVYGSSSPELIIKENGCQFSVSVEDGQKTGFFLDQRDNRALLSKFSQGKSILNTFCYSGGFSISALLNGAKSVCSVDSSSKAIDLVIKNNKLNSIDPNRHRIVKDDVMHFLRDDKTMYDIIILDPPAYAKSVKKRHNAIQAYKRLNIEGMSKLKSGGFLFTFSCSQVISKQIFLDTVMSAAMDVKRNVRILQHLSQPSDHPNNIFHPEGSYLKGLLLYIE